MALVAACNAGDFVLCWILSALQRRKPSADRYAQRLKCKPPMNVWKSLDLCKPGLKKIPSPLAIRSRIVVECRRDLDQTLQEHSFRILSLEPDFLPMFVGVVKAPCIEGFQSFPEKAIFVVRIHDPQLPANARVVESMAS
jgi:hypothetical protein